MTKKMSLILLSSLVMVMFLAMALSGPASALPTMGTDCYQSGCHAAGQPPTKASVVKPEPAAPKPAEPAKEEAKPAPAAPASSAPAKASPAVKNTITLVGQESKTLKGTVVKDSLLVPVRAAAEFFGATVNWDNSEKAASVYLGDKVVVVNAVKKTATVGGAEAALGGEVRIQQGRLMVPVQFLAEALGLTLEQDDAGVKISQTK